MFSTDAFFFKHLNHLALFGLWFKHHLFNTITQKSQGTYKCILGGAGVGLMLSNMVEKPENSVKTSEPGQVTCPDPDLNPDRRGDKRVHYLLRYPAW